MRSWASTALPAGIVWSGGDKVTMLVDSGATEHFVESLLTPGLQDSMRDFRALDVPYQVEGIGLKYSKASQRERPTAPLSMTVVSNSRSPFTLFLFQG